jgi:hypothetical protein
MGWAVFLIACFLTIPIGWLVLTRPRADRFLAVVGLTLLVPTIWAAAIGLKIGPCDSTSCVTHTQRNLLVLAVPALVVLGLALVAIFRRLAVPAAALMTLAAILDFVATWKVDRVTTVMFGILAGAVATYLVLALLPNRASETPGFPPA